MPAATENFQQTATIGDFASAIGDAVKANPDQEQPKEVQKVESTPDTEKPAEVVKEVEKEPVKKADLSNPNLTTVKTEAKDKQATDDEVAPKGMTGKALETWKTIKTELKQIREERDAERQEKAALKKQLEEAGKSGPELDSLKKDRDSLRQQLQEYEGEMAVHRVESTKRYKETIGAPMAAVQSTVDDLAKRYEVPADSLMRALQQPDAGKRAEELEEIMSDFKRVDQMELVQAAKDYHRLQKDATAMRADASKRLEELTREETAQNEQQSAQTIKDYRGAVSAEWDQLQQHIPYIRKFEGNDQWNAHLDDIMREVESVNVNELPVEDVAKARISQAVLPEILNVAKHFEAQAGAEKARADKAEKQLAAYIKNAPGAGNGRGDSSLENGGSDNDSAPFSKIIGAAVRAA
jgi:hypothetical protein